MTPRIKDIIDLMNTFVPFSISEPWDNSGLQVGSPGWKVRKIIIGLDVTVPLLDAAHKVKADLIITHHPLMLKPEKVIDFSTMPGQAIERCALHQIGIVSVHTNLDKVRSGLNDYFAGQIGVKKIFGFLDKDASSGETNGNTGIGRIGELESEMPLSQLVSQIKDRLNLGHIRVTGDLDQPVKTVAICTGSGGSLLNNFLDSGADVYITGDIKYHDARKAEDASKALVDVGHFGSEHLVIDLLFEKLNTCLMDAGLKVGLVCYKKEKDPFTIV